MSMWADYLKERRGALVEENEHGFASYYINAPNAYVENVYVKAEHRRAGHGKQLIGVIEAAARKKGCNTLYGSIDMGTAGITVSTKGFFACGFDLSHLEGNAIILKKDLGASHG